MRTHLVVERPGFTLDLPLEVADGEVVALLGPNGAGKTTALRALAGLEPGFEPPGTGPVGVVFQDYLLFPHLSALENVAFGPRCQGVPKAEARRTAAAWLARMGLAEFARRRPKELSGGQAQRVALARALAVRPGLLLMDEPLAALDAHTRLEVRAGLRKVLAAFDGACVLVTHDALDAMVLADRLVVIENGRMVQEGAPAEVARRPRTSYVARLVGLNLYRGRADGHVVSLNGSLSLHVAESLTGEVFVAFPPSAVALYRTRPDGTPRNLWEGGIDGIEQHGDSVRVHLEGPLAVSADITAAALAELGLAHGQRVWASVKATETHAYPA
ncbi:ABC transporter ATP-binding protein [Nonomuraea africana]|uniref:Molybdate transport system ATP-binding protein n=1 Tax=Nonomuraea africana TaxID=46171 RepID=A0ABR9KL08_9ACTN|nr:ABC transporter ATP-binding protein [Nonomuraea africana]MBE1562698.1 molybdate transport system ATP-binding protein [Nonomuraea africana]